MGKGSVPGRAVRLESLALPGLLVCLYSERDGSWLLFTALFLMPDLSALDYLIPARVGAIEYNLGHTLIGPVALALPGIMVATPLAATLGIIRAAYIAFDRAVGYGFKTQVPYPRVVRLPISSHRWARERISRCCSGRGRGRLIESCG